jgi:hypothetical protein
MRVTDSGIGIPPTSNRISAAVLTGRISRELWRERVCLTVR